MEAKKFEYLRDVARKYGGFYGVQEFESFIDHVSDEQLKELRAAYETIDSRDDSFRISRWIDDCFERRGQITKTEFNFSSDVGQLLLLFDYLSRRGIQPFSSEKVEYVEIIKKPNWENLPHELHYLIDVAEAYGVYSSESDVRVFLDHAHPSDRETLARTAERIRLSRHSTLIDEWVKKHPFEKHQEAWMIYWLVVVMAHAGLDLEPLP
jgi:hypothetical protein